MTLSPASEAGHPSSPRSPRPRPSPFPPPRARPSQRSFHFPRPPPSWAHLSCPQAPSQPPAYPPMLLLLPLASPVTSTSTPLRSPSLLSVPSSFSSSSGALLPQSTPPAPLRLHADAAPHLRPPPPKHTVTYHPERRITARQANPHPPHNALAPPPLPRLPSPSAYLLST